MQQDTTSLEGVLGASDDIGEFAKGYFDYLSTVLGRIEEDEIRRFVSELEDAREEGRTIFVAGNGGSAATANHIANDLSLGGPPGSDIQPFEAQALTTNTPVLTAVANDFGYEDVFIKQLEAHYDRGDILVGISASGTSENILRAAEWVQDRGGTVLGLVGFDGGTLKERSDVAIHVPTKSGEYGPVEDAHMILDHVLYTWFWYELRQEHGW